jgi:putative membrane protein
MRATIAIGVMTAALTIGFSLPSSASPDSDEAAPLTAAGQASGSPVEPLRPNARLVEALVSQTNRSEVEAGRYAIQRASSPEVRAFAARMIRDHSKLERDLASISPESRSSESGAAAGTTSAASEHPLLANLREDATEAMSQLEQVASTTSFDSTYMVSQLALHAEVLGLLDEMIRNEEQGTSESVRSLLQKARSDVAEHLKLAAQIYASMQQPSSGSH